MSLERKDVRFKIDPAAHAQLTVLADIDQRDIGEWVEAIVAAEIARRVHVHTVAAQRLARLGTSGKNRE